MDFYNKYLCRAIMCMLLVTCSMFAYAQGTPTITVSPVEMTDGFKEGSTIYSILADSIKYNVSVPEGYTITKAEWTLYVDYGEFTSSTETKTNLSFETGKAGIYTLEGKVTVSWKDGKDDVSEEVRVESDIEVEFLDKPNLQIDGDSKIVSYHNRKIKLGLTTTNVKGEWKVTKWSSGTEYSAPTDKGYYRYEVSYPNTSGEDKNITLVPTCNYVYKDHVFATVMPVFNITVSPEIKLDYSTAKEFSTAKNETFTLGVDAKGGKLGTWKYEWKKNGLSIAGSSETNEVTVSPGFSAYDEEYSAVVSYMYDDETFDSKELDFVIHVFPTPEINPNIKETQHVLDEQSIEFKVQHSGGYEDGWSYEWKKMTVSTGEEMSLSNTTEKHSQAFDPEEESGEFYYKVRVVNEHNGTVLADSTLSFHVIVYATPEVTPILYNDIVVGNRQFTLGVEITGGDPNGWSFNWTRRTGDIDLSSEYGSSVRDFEESNETQDFVEYTYILHYINTFTLEDRVWIDDSCEFNVKVYPNVTIVYTKEPTGKEISLYQEPIELGAKYSGGYDGTGSRWDFKWIHNDNELGHNESEYTHEAKNPTAPSETDNYTLLAQLFKDDLLLYDNTLEYKVVSYRLQEVNAVTKQVIHTSGDKEFRFAVKAEYAYPGGWTYQWKRDGVVIDSEINDELKHVEQNENASDSIKHVYEVIAYNHCDGKLWDSDTLTFEAVVWPEITLPVQRYYDEQVRECDNLNLAADKGTGGYSDGWEYKWYNTSNISPQTLIYNQDSNELKGYSSNNEGKYGHSRMQNRQETYTLYYKNVHKPSGTTLIDGSIRYDVTLYRCPMEPFELVRKGNGTSNIYIADMRSSNQGFNDATLAELEYNFCFGYGDNNEINREDATKRYYQYTKEQANQKPWVYTYWEYNDGYVCKSDKVHYGQSRGTTSIEGVYEEYPISISSKGFTAVMPYAMPAKARLISINGEVVKEMHYEDAVEFDESFEFGGLEKGFYMVEVCIGENREVNKIFINK